MKSQKKTSPDPADKRVFPSNTPSRYTKSLKETASPETAENPAAAKSGTEELTPAQQPLTSPAVVRIMGMQNTKAGISVVRKPFAKWVTGEIPGVDVASGSDQLSGKHVLVPLQLSVAPGYFMPVGFDISWRDNRLMNAAASIIEQTGSYQFTLRQLINVSRHRSDNPTVDKNTLIAAMERLSALANIGIVLNFEEHKAYNLMNVSKAKILDNGYQTNLFPADFYHQNGETLIIMRGKPPLSAYAEQARQIVSYPQDVLDLTTIYHKDEAGNVIHPEKTGIKRMTTQILDIEDYIVQELHRIKQQHGHKSGARGYILYSSIYAALEKGTDTFDSTNKASRQKVNGNIQRVCDTLTEKTELGIKAITTELKDRRKYRLVITLA